ncbi:MAG: TRAP transporter large permease subunit, partial [Burkholderiales bacterium]
VPAWVVQWVMPVGFAAIALRSLWSGGTTHPQRAALAVFCAICLAVFALDVFPRQPMVTVGLCLLGLGAILGAAVFAVLGGVAVLLFWGSELPIASLAVDHYRLVVNPALPAIPLFTLAGYFLAEGGAPARLVRVFHAAFGNRSGGAAAVTVVACAFFTAFTGASGAAILALGGLLLPLLVASGQSQRSALGLVTSAGSLGVLLPPSLPLILYAVVAKVPLRDLFLSAIVPALLLLSLVFLWARWAQARVPPVAEKAREPLGPALKAARWELLLPIVAFGTLFSGWATPVEAAAVTAFYAFVVEVFVYRGLSLRSGVPRVAAECGLLLGGILLILGVALGFTNFLADAQVPGLLVDWVRDNLESKWVFLLALNVFLLAVGCFMDIFSAIVVVVPLIVPLGAAFGVDPIHLGIIFLANMELGYLTPPVGMNLYFASYRFERPLGEVAWASFPYVVVLALGVLVITYVPWISSLSRVPF